MNRKLTELVLTCGSWQEAQKIADMLLEQKLVANVELIEVPAKDWFKSELEEAKEVKLIMQSLTEHFDTIEAMVKKLHRYETPNEHALPSAQTMGVTKAWLEQEIRS